MYQILVKDRCTSNGKTYKIDISNNITMMEFKEKVFEKASGGEAEASPGVHAKDAGGRKEAKAAR